MVISLQKLKPALLNLLDLKSLLTKLEAQLVSHPRLALTPMGWWKHLVCVQVHETLIIHNMMSDTLYVVLHICLVDKSLQFNLYRIHNIPLVHPILKKSFKNSIQKEYLSIISDSQYILFPLSTNIMAWQLQMANFVTLIPLYIQQILQILVVMLFFLQDKKRINRFCILSVINQTQDEAFNINGNFWAISTLLKNKSYT